MVAGENAQGHIRNEQHMTSKLLGTLLLPLHARLVCAVQYIPYILGTNMTVLIQAILK